MHLHRNISLLAIVLLNVTAATHCRSQPLTLTCARLDGVIDADDITVGRGHGIQTCADDDRFSALVVGNSTAQASHIGQGWPECTDVDENIFLSHDETVLDADEVFCVGVAASQAMNLEAFSFANTMAMGVCTTPIGSSNAVPSAFCNVTGTEGVFDSDCCDGGCSCLQGAHAMWDNMSECLTRWGVNGATLGPGEMATLYKYMFIAGYGGPSNPHGFGPNVGVSAANANIAPQVVCHVGASCVIADRFRPAGCTGWTIYGTLSDSTSTNPGAQSANYNVLCMPDGFNLFLPSTEAVANGSQFIIRTATQGSSERFLICEESNPSQNGTDIWSFVSTGYATAVADQPPVFP